MWNILNNTKPENEVNQINVSPRNSTTSNDSCALRIDESKSNDETSINDEPNLNDESHVTKPIPFYVGDSEPCIATLSQMQVNPYEEHTEYNQIASYSSKLPSIEQLLSQKDLQQGTSSGKQKKD